MNDLKYIVKKVEIIFTNRDFYTIAFKVAIGKLNLEQINPLLGVDGRIGHMDINLICELNC